VVDVGPLKVASPSSFPLVAVIVPIFVVITLIVIAVYVFVVVRARRRQALGYYPIDGVSV
jgi:heme/copper-type cytochrome/quinol oxidase subunit 2